MRSEALARLASLPDSARVLDVGGWAAPLNRADAVIDLFPYETRGLYGAVDEGSERFTRADWVQADICGPQQWPIADNEFDFAVCSHTLEDVRDPVFVCSELQRVAKAGYIEVPSLIEELTIGLHGDWVGWSHHRWLTELDDGVLKFTHKPHLLGAAGRHLPAGTNLKVDESERVISHFWQGSLPAEEVVYVDADRFDDWLEGSLKLAAKKANVEFASWRELDEQDGLNARRLAVRLRNRLRGGAPE